MLVVERGGTKHTIERATTETDPSSHRVVFRSKDLSVVFELRKSKLGGYSHGFVVVSHGVTEYRKRLGRIEIEAMRRNLLGGDEHVILVGDVLVRLSPDTAGYLFPKEKYKRFLRFFKGLWELGRKIKELGRFRR